MMIQNHHSDHSTDQNIVCIVYICVVFVYQTILLPVIIHRHEEPFSSGVLLVVVGQNHQVDYITLTLSVVVLNLASDISS